MDIRHRFSSFLLICWQWCKHQQPSSKEHCRTRLILVNLILFCFDFPRFQISSRHQYYVKRTRRVIVSLSSFVRLRQDASIVVVLRPLFKRIQVSFSGTDRRTMDWFEYRVWEKSEYNWNLKSDKRTRLEFIWSWKSLAVRFFPAPNCSPNLDTHSSHPYCSHEAKICALRLEHLSIFDSAVAFAAHRKIQKIWRKMRRPTC